MSDDEERESDFIERRSTGKHPKGQTEKPQKGHNQKHPKGHTKKHHKRQNKKPHKGHNQKHPKGNTKKHHKRQNKKPHKIHNKKPHKTNNTKHHKEHTKKNHRTNNTKHHKEHTKKHHKGHHVKIQKKNKNSHEAKGKKHISHKIYKSKSNKNKSLNNEGAKTNVVLKHMGGKPSGPIAEREELEQKYLTYFSRNAKANIPWQEPKILRNCWAQSMLSSRFGFSPSCQIDGSFTAKQCYLERCWCVSRAGKPQVSDPDQRFYYAIAGIMLVCSQN